MPVNSIAAQERRKLRFASLDEMVADAEVLVSCPACKMLGHWPLNQLLAHLATAMNASIDGIPFSAPWHLRMLGPFIKRRLLQRGIPAGFALPKNREAAAFPATASPQEALNSLRQAAGRLRNEPATAKHPLFGKLTHEEWMQLHLRHAELHLSFAVPG